MELDSSAKSRLEQLFVACERKGTGFLGPTELRELCAGLGLGPSEADALFADLDRDGDGRINFDDFAAGFREFVLLPGQNSTGNGIGSPPITNDMDAQKRKREMMDVWKMFVKQFNQKVNHVVSSECLNELEKIVLTSQPSPQLLVSFKKLFSDLIQHVDRIEKENAHLEHSFKRERESHKQHLDQLEDEMERQVKQLKETVQQQIKEETEAETRALRAQLEAEKAEMQAHLALFQSFGNFVKQDHGEHTEKFRIAQEKLEEANQDNRQLRLNLAEMQTNVALLRSDLAQLRTQYEDKCKELHKEKEVMFEYIHEHDHLTRQLNLLHEANKRLQDMNDHLRGSVDAAHLYQQMQGFRKRAHVLQGGSIMTDCVHGGNNEVLVGNGERNRSIAGELTGSGDFVRQNVGNHLNTDVTYGLTRFMEDIDSGMSTMRDTNEFDDVPSDDEDGEKNRRSLEFDSAISQSHPLATSTPDNHVCQRLDNTQTVPDVGPPERTFKVVFAGDAAVGKSTFILRVSKGMFIPTVSSTLGVDFHMRTIKVDDINVTLQLWDTAGQERFRSLTKSYFRRADGVMLLFDCANEKSFINVRNWMEAIDEIIDKRLPIILCANKTDLRKSAQMQNRTVIEAEDGERLAREFGAIYIETSAKNGDNVMDAVFQLTRQMVANEDREVKFRSNVIDVGKDVPQKRGCGCSK